MYFPYPPSAININSCKQNYKCYSKLLSQNPDFTSSSMNFDLFDGQCVLDQCQSQVSENSGYCYNNGDCETNYCNLTSNVCETLQEGATCLAGKNQCGKGLICYNNQTSQASICTKVIPKDSACSIQENNSSYYQLCAYGTQCAYNGTAAAKQGPYCLGAFSQPGGSFVELAVASVQPHASDMLCSTFQYQENNSTCFNEAVTLNSTTANNGRKCSSNADCGSSTTPTITGICSCDFANSQGQAYCQGFYGDNVYTQYFNQYKQSVQDYSNNLQNCAEYNFSISSQNCVLPNITMTLLAYSQSGINIAGVDNHLEQYNINTFGSGDTLNSSGKCPVYSNSTQNLNNYTLCRSFDSVNNVVQLSDCLSDYLCENLFVYPSTSVPTPACNTVSSSSSKKQIQDKKITQTSRRRNLAGAGPAYQSTQYCYRNGIQFGIQPQDQSSGYPLGNFLGIGAFCVNTSNTAGNNWKTDCVTTVCQNVDNQTNVGTCGILYTGNNCTSSIQCDKNLLCSIGDKYPTCQPILSVGASCDNETFSLCPSNTQCILLYGSSQPYTFSCQLMFSVQGNNSFSLILPNGLGQQGTIVEAESVTSTQSPYFSAFSQACQTGTFDVITNACKIDYEKTLFLPGQSFPLQCSSNTDCLSTYGNLGICSCLPNTKGQGYCQGFFGDFEYNVIQFNQLKTQIQNINYTGNPQYPYLQLLPNTTVQNINNIFNLADITTSMPYLWSNFTNVPYELQGTCYDSIFEYQYPNFFSPYSQGLSQMPLNLTQNITILPFNVTSFKPFPNATSNCTRYRCNGIAVNKSTGICMEINFNYPYYKFTNESQGNIGNLEIDVSSCGDDYTCYSSFLAQANNLFSVSNSTNPALGYYNYEGQCILNQNQGKRSASSSPSSSSSTFCYRDSDCITNFCNENTCMWKTNQTSCELGQSQCGPNMTCFLSKCYWILPEGAKCSETLNETNYQLCAQGTVCASYLKNSSLSLETTCVSLFSLDVNTSNINVVGSNIIPVQYLCYYGQYNNITQTCIYPDKTKNGFPFACTSDTDCIGVNGTQGVCNCDTPTVDGTAYCKGFPGDAPYQSVITKTQASLKNYLKNYPQCAEYMTLASYTGNMKKQCTPIDLSNFTTPIFNGYVPGVPIPQCLLEQGVTFPSNDGIITQGNLPFNVQTQLCPAYQCSQSLVYDNEISITFCRYQNVNLQNYTNQWFLAACPENYECLPYSNATNVVGQQFYKNCVKNGPYAGLAIPYGGLCSLLNKLDISSLDCLTEVCLDQPTNYEGYGICGVLSENQTCKSDIQCGKGMKCFQNPQNTSNTTCLPTLKIGDECDVLNYKLCPFQSSCIMKQYYVYDSTTFYTCQPFYSQPSGANFSVIIEGFMGGGQIVRQPVLDQNLDTKQFFDQMCQSGSFNSSLLECNPYMEYSYNVPPIQCQSDQDCIGIFGTVGSCECFPNTEGYKYCKLLPGDLQPYVNYFQKLVQYAQQDFSKCFPFEYLYEGPSNNQSWGGCYAQDAKSYWLQLQQVYTPVDPQYVPSCFSSQFWNYGFKTFQFSYGDKLSVALVMILLTFLVMFI